MMKMSETAADGNGAAPAAPDRGGAGPVLLGVIVLAATALRLGAAVGDLWIDEVWSLDNVILARTLANGADWVALFFHTNTHALNTLYMGVIEAALGPDADPFAFRALSVVTGSAAVPVAFAVGRRRSPTEGLIAAAMVAVSYPMVHYAGEARGYAPMLLAALVAYALFERCLEAPTRGRIGAFIAVSLLGLAAHMTFVLILGALGVWAMTVLFRRPEPVVRTLARLTVLFGVQAVAVTAYGAVAWNNLATGGGAEMMAAESVGIITKAAFGIDPGSKAGLTTAIAVGLFCFVWWFQRRGMADWIFFAIVVVAFPLVMVIVDPAHGTVPRYFIASVLFALIAAARGLALMLAAGPWPRAVAGGLLALFLVGNGLLLGKFYGPARGHYAAAVKFIAAEGNTGGRSGKTVQRVAGGHQLSIDKLIAYHGRRRGLSGAVRYVDPKEDARAPADWYIDTYYDGYYRARIPAPEFYRASGKGKLTLYKLKKVFPHWGLSGDTWALYRRAG